MAGIVVSKADPHFSKVAIVGLGLIGGSMALSISRAYPGVTMTGVDTDPSEVDLAVKLGAISTGGTELELIRGADLLIIATPIRAIHSILSECERYLAPGAVITDVGSTKGYISKAAAELLNTCIYIGGHSMAGSEKGGMSAASPVLFENAVYVLSPDSAPRESVNRLKAFLSCTGAVFLEIKPGEHDTSAAMVSHLPHLLAAVLVDCVNEGPDPQLSLSLAGGGFRDTTRIASGDPIMWRDIFLSNAPAVKAACEIFRRSLCEFEAAVTASDGNRIEELLARAKEIRDALPAKQKGVMAPVYDIVVVLADEPGAINRVAGILGESGINIKDIEILRIREGFGGTLRIGFEEQPDAERAAELLEKQGFIAKVR